MNKAENAEAGLRAKLIHVSGFMNFLDPVLQDLVGPADLIIFQRNIAWQESLDAIEYWQGMGKPVCVDIDDAYQFLPWSNPAKQFWHLSDNGEHLKFMVKGMKLSDGLISPNRLLLNDWSHCTRGYYLQNYAEKAWWSDLPDREELKFKRGLSNRIVIGWGGSVSHYDSWWGSGIREAAERVCQRHPEVMWMICGNDYRIFEQLPVPSDQKVFQPGVPPETWPQVVKSFDIGVAPLTGLYDQRRSWIKGMEYALAGIPWVATQGEPYKDIADLGMLVDDHVDVWEFALEETIKDLPKLQEQGQERLLEVQKRFIVDYNLDVFRATYERIIADFRDEKGRLSGVAYVD